MKAPNTVLNHLANITDAQVADIVDNLAYHWLISLAKWNNFPGISPGILTLSVLNLSGSDMVSLMKRSQSWLVSELKSLKHSMSLVTFILV